MNIEFGNFKMEGDFKVIDFVERGYDRDFYVDPLTSVINLIVNDGRIQFTNVSFINIRCSIKVDLVTIHFHLDTSLHSSFSNLIFSIDNSPLIIERNETGVFLLIPDTWKLMK